MTSLEPYYEESQSIYDVSDEFFALFLDPTMGYTCAYFERDDMTLEEAQNAKFDLALGKLNLEPGMTLLDVGCGWGGALQRAVEKFDVNVVGLTLSENQAEHVQQMFDQLETNRSAQVLLEGWEKFDEPVDRIVSIGAFEHFGRQRWGHFFKMAYRVLPADGVMLLHTISRPTFKEARAQGTPLTHEVVHFTQFILAEIFPGGWLPTIPSVEEHAADAGFKVTRIQSLQLHYARTLEIWAAALESNKDKAIAIQSEKVYDRYMKYLTGCAKLFRQGYTDVNQFTCEK
ncbi:cyclopropane mycolic acid synthase family methyltransferase [Mycobacterium sp. 1245805.9]|uniref:cyclopropane mycolic acid synthase family methyltransferase n=1 Tax=Mycobacterium sp. 1245805.9 TaxID=1856862 RepID=UPI000801C112|nr:cyclopropane mycolic acid synthase family methyltransferase [Mycobacterium sp. 1245805.9]OBI87831.1 SAM-dependent methyltransferase [Mycobacterium sp. 1245805.9]